MGIYCLEVDCRKLYQEGTRIYFDMVFPERILARYCQHQALAHPKLAMLVEVVVSTILGTIKILSLPLMSLAGIVLLPAICLTKCISKKSFSPAPSYFLSWMISILVTALIVASIFCLIMVSPEVVFLMIGILGAMGTSATLLNIHKELFSPQNTPNP